MTILFTIGMILLAAGSIVFLVHPLTNATCNLRFYLYGIGSVMTITAPLLKAYRIAKIYSITKTNSPMNEIVIKDSDLIRNLFGTIAFELGLCIAYSILHSIEGGIECFGNEDYEYVECECNQSDAVAWVSNANYFVVIFLLLAFCYFAVRTRPSAKVFRESTCAYFGSFFSLFTFGVVVLFNLIADDLSAIISIQSAAVIIVLIVIWVLFYGLYLCSAAHCFFLISFLISCFLFCYLFVYLCVWINV